jgi:hypothetical protein
MESIDIFYQREGLLEIEHLEIGQDQTFGAVKALVIEKHALAADVALFLEDADEPVDVAVTIEEIAKKGPVKVHLHRCRHVEVSVSFGGRTASKRFGPGATIARIKRWAAEHEFHMTPGDAAEHLLQIKETTTRPSPSTHVGTLVKCPNCAIAFDLIPQARVQG